MSSFYFFMLGLGIGYLIRQLENLAELRKQELDQ